MKKVMNAAEVAKAWLKQDEARTPTRNFSVSGDALYSYRTVIARKFEWGIVLNATRYSSTTNNHQSEARTVASRHGLPVYDIGGRPFGDLLLVTTKDVADWQALQARDSLEKMKRRKSNGPMANRALQNYGPMVLRMTRAVAKLDKRLGETLKEEAFREISRLGQIVGGLPETVAGMLA